MATPNLVLPTGRLASAADRRPKSKSLAALIDKLNATVADVDKWSSREDELSNQFRESAGPAPKVKGGVTQGFTLVRDSKPVMNEPAGDWFYRSRIEIEKGRNDAVLDAKSEDELAQAEERFAALLADWDTQEAVYNSTKPRGLDHAKRMLNKAHRAWLEAENEIVNYQPKSVPEVIELLAYAGRDEMRGVFFMPGEGELKFMMRNAAAAIRNAE